VFSNVIKGLLGITYGLFVVWCGFMIVPIWRSANKYRGKRVWAILAKFHAIWLAMFFIGVLVTVFLLAFGIH
jgi:hypothetical protein